MSARTSQDWQSANHDYLCRCIDETRRRLKKLSGDTGSETVDHSGMEDFPFEELPALDRLSERFTLSVFERGILLICAGAELSSDLASLCAEAQGDPNRDYPTFSLALATLGDPHWSALSPNAPLRRFELIEVNRQESLTSGRLRIDESILHYLCGLQYSDERLEGSIHHVQAEYELVSSQRSVADQIMRVWESGLEQGLLKNIHICGYPESERQSVAAAACAILGLNLYAIPASVLPLTPEELKRFIRLCERYVILNDGALLLEVSDGETEDSLRAFTIRRFVEICSVPLIVSARSSIAALPGKPITVEVSRPEASEQHALWQTALADLAPSVNGQLERLVSQFNLSATDIHAVSARTKMLAASSTHEMRNMLWSNCRIHTRQQMDDMAQRIPSSATWEDLVIPEAQRQALREIAVHVRRRFKVYELWGYSSKSSRGLGITALFSGLSGTGKTMAAEVLGVELDLDVYRIDLSQVISKYIGETEKNLRRVFAAAEEGGAILLFDEADALFGKRSDVKDSHDRYANIEVSYLLQKMEDYRGLAILTTNNKSALDQAFLRRIRFVVQFPFPDYVQRAEIWRRIFPVNAPLADLDYSKLAQISVSGGNIRNIALNAAFLAADADESVHMKHLLRAARTESAKLDKPLSESEISGWL